MPYKYAEDYKVSTAIESTPACVGTNKRLESKEIEKNTNSGMLLKFL